MSSEGVRVSWRKSFLHVNTFAPCACVFVCGYNPCAGQGRSPSSPRRMLSFQLVCPSRECVERRKQGKMASWQLFNTSLLS
jgi:hypothetical protein